MTIFGKSWLLHVTDVSTTPEENLLMIEDTVRYPKEQGKEVVYDAEHFFDGFVNNNDYALSTQRPPKEAVLTFSLFVKPMGGN